MTQTILPNQIHTYYSSRTEALTGILLAQLQAEKAAFDNPFQRLHIVVPNSGMQRYLELKIAEHFGICTHVELSFASRFLGQCYRLALPHLSRLPYLDTRQLAFELLALWQSPDTAPDHPQIEQLLSQCQTAKQRYGLADHVARLLNQYLKERPELITHWQRGQTALPTHVHETWQMQLFNQLQLGRFSGTALQQRFHAALSDMSDMSEQTHLKKPTLPNVHLFGFHAIPPMQLADFSALSTVASVQAYVFNPSVEYWQDIVPEAVKAQTSLTAEDEAELMSVGNPLLAGWGQSGKYLIEQLNNSQNSLHIDADLIANQQRFTVNSMLTWVQESIRFLHNDTEQPTLPSPAALPDIEQEITQQNHSISLHSGAGERREVEILYDNLCTLFADETAAISPSDVLVMVADLKDYAPHIEAVFGTEPRAIPFSLANQTAASADADTQAFLALLTMIDSDFSAQTLFDALSEDRVCQHFELNPTDVQTIRHWLVESRFAGGFVDDTDGRGSSLEKLLDALLLAGIGGADCQVQRPTADSTGKTIAALPAYQSGQHPTLEIFCLFLSRLQYFVRLKQRQQTLVQWKADFYRLASDFLGEQNPIQQRLTQWYDSLTQTSDDKADNVGQTHVENTVFDAQTTLLDYETIHTDLLGLLENEVLHGPFLSGGVSFCAMVPMRSIPAKMIVLLGLNQSFPNVVAKDPLDLRHADPRWSDRDANKEYRYFFLETLMAARQRLYLSYVGQNDKTGEPMPASILVDELFAFIERHHKTYAKTAKKSYPLQGFIATEKPTFQTLYQPKEPKKPNNSDHANPTRSAATPPDDAVSASSQREAQLSAKALAEAIDQPFICHVKQALQSAEIALPDNHLAEYDMVGFDDGLDNWFYREQALKQQLFGEHSVSSLIQQNRYAPEAISRCLLAQSQTHVEPLAKALTHVAGGENPRALSAFISVIDSSTHVEHLLLNLSHYNDLGAWQYRFSKPAATHLIRYWVNHVLLNLVPDLPAYTSWFFSLNDGVVEQIQLAPLTQPDARKALDNLLTLYAAIIEHPFPVELKLAPKFGKNVPEQPTALIYIDKPQPLYPALQRGVTIAALDTLNNQLHAVDKDLSAALQTPTRTQRTVT